MEHGRMLERRLLYTAITRARTLLIVIGPEDATAIATESLREGQLCAIRERIEDLTIK